MPCVSLTHSPPALLPSYSLSCRFVIICQSSLYDWVMSSYAFRCTLSFFPIDTYVHLCLNACDGFIRYVCSIKSRFCRFIEVCVCVCVRACVRACVCVCVRVPFSLDKYKMRFYTTRNFTHLRMGRKVNFTIICY